MPGRVLHVLSSNERRGAQSFGVQLHQELATRGWQSDVVSLVGSDDPGHLQVHPLGSSRHDPAGLLALRRAAAARDVVVAHGSTTLLACGVGLAASPTPFVYVNIGDPRFWWRGRARRLRVRTLLRRAAAVAAISESGRRVLVDELRLPPSAVHVIPNGRSATLYPRADPSRRLVARRALGLDPAATVVAWVGALSPEKRPDVAVDAMARLPGAQLVVAGDGPELDRLAARASARAPGRVHLLGRTDRVVDVLTAADAVLLTSDSEGLPGVLIEAGLVGVPAVSTDVGWVHEVVVDGVTGRLVPPGRPDAVAVAVEEVLADAARMGEAANRHCVDRFEMQIVVDRWEQLLEGVLTVRMTARTPRG
jgi:glycosyltransferase involved in cell wall biosynthesis